MDCKGVEDWWGLKGVGYDLGLFKDRMDEDCKSRGMWRAHEVGG